MTLKDHSLLSIFLCIALVITMLPLLGGAGPAAARGQNIKTVIPGDTIFVYEKGLNIQALDATGGVLSFSLVKFVNDDISKARIKEIPISNAARFDVLASQVGTDYGKYYTANGTGAFPGLFVQIAQPTATLGVVLSGSHTTSLDGKTITNDTSIAFRIASPQVGTSYRTAAGVYEGQLAIEVTTPSGTKVQQMGGVSLSAINVSGAELYTAAIPLYGAVPGTYSAVAKWITPDWKNQAPNSNAVTFTVQSGTIPPAPAMVTLSGRVVTTNGAGISGISVYFWRQDNGKSFYVTTDRDGKFSAQVEKSTDVSKRYNIAANRDTGDASHPKNPLYTTAELTNVVPSMDRTSLNFRLEKGLVTLGGRVTDSGGKGIPDLWVYYWRQDGQDAAYARTNATGYYSREVARFPATDTFHRYNLAANKDNGDSSHPKNPAFATKEFLNITPDMNRLYLNFKLVATR